MRTVKHNTLLDGSRRAAAMNTIIPRALQEYKARHSL